MIDRIGQLFITGFEGMRPSQEFLEFYESNNIGGLVLFEEQCNPHTLAEENIKTITDVSKNVPFIAIDQEGGRICRFRGVPAEFPSVSEFGQKNDLDLYKESFSRAAYYIRSLGVNLWLGPVADLGINKNNPCLKNRTFGSNPAKVIPFIESSVKILSKVGLLSCLKHFPGLGAAENDPHTKTSTANYDFNTFINRESLTFKAGIDSGTDMIMTTHLYLSNIDAKMATGSERIISLLLREKLNFDKTVITDDLTMDGAALLGDSGNRALKAFNAGHDILLYGKDFHSTKLAVEHFKDAYRNNLLDKNRLEMSLDRIAGLKLKMTSSLVM